RVTALVLEDEHADASRLAIATRNETDLPRPGGCFAQRQDDRVDLAGRPMPEKRERDVQVLSRDDPNACELRTLPPLDLVEDAVGQAQREEEREPFIATHASGRGHADSLRLPVRSARRRWSAVTVARTRICW